MDIKTIFNKTNHWLSCSWKALNRGSELTYQLSDIMRNDADQATRDEAKRLYFLVQDAMRQIRQNSPNVSNRPRVAFLPVAKYDDATGTTTTPEDTIQYPERCNMFERIDIQYAEAERQFLAFGNAVTEQPDNVESEVAVEETTEAVEVVEVVAESVVTDETPAEVEVNTEVVDTPEVEVPVEVAEAPEVEVNTEVAEAPAIETPSEESEAPVADQITPREYLRRRRLQKK